MNQPQAPTPEQGPRSAVERFFTSADMLRCLGEQIIPKSSLSTLCLINRQFHVEFSYFLYREVDIVGNWTRLDAGANNRGWSAKSSPNLKHVRKATVRMVWPGHPSVFNQHLCEILPRMPELRILHWDKSPMNFRTLEIIRTRFPRLNGLALSFPGNVLGEFNGAVAPNPGGQDDYRADLNPVLTEQVSLTMARALERRLGEMNTRGLPFAQNLRYFSYSNIYGDLSIQRRAIVNVLRHSPQLEHLGLALAPFPSDTFTFFERLCDEYGVIGGSPLKLKSLHCGRDIVPPGGPTLARLTDVSYLESLMILNDTVRGHGDPQSTLETEQGTVNPLDAFEPSKCPRLKHLWFAMHSNAVNEFVSKFVRPAPNGRPSSRLMDCFTMYPYAHIRDTILQNTAPQLLSESSPRPAEVSLPFRMLNITLAVEDNSEAETPASDISSPDDDDKNLHRWGVQDALDSLRYLVDTTSHTLEGLGIDLPTRITQNGVAVQRDVSRAIHVLLPRLTALKALAIRIFAHEDDDTWEEPPHEQLLGLARYFAQLLPGLRHIAVMDFFWRINRTPTGLYLEEMVRGEIDYVEFFHRSWPAPLIFRWTPAHDLSAILDPHPFPYFPSDSHLK